MLGSQREAYGMSLDQLTVHFAVSEFAQKSRQGISSQPYPAEWINERLRPLCDALEALRTILERPIKVISGFRSEEYNKAIGGARLSQHVQGRAADIVIPGVDAQVVHDMALDLYKAGRLNIGGLGDYPGFTHVDV